MLVPEVLAEMDETKVYEVSEVETKSVGTQTGPIQTGVTNTAVPGGIQCPMSVGGHPFDSYLPK